MSSCPPTSCTPCSNSRHGYRATSAKQVSAADARRAQIVLIEVVGVSPELEARRHAVLNEFADLVTDLWLDTVEPTTVATADGGGARRRVNHLLVDWLLSGKTQQPSDLVQACATLFAGSPKPAPPHTH